MKSLFEQGLIEKYEGEGHVSYILNDNSLFFPTGLKAIQNEKNQGILKCIQIKFNGKDKLIYLTEGYQKLDEKLPTMTEENFVKIAKNFIAIIRDLQEDSFLKCSHIDFETDRIFVDSSTGAVYLVYLPVVDNRVEKIKFDFNREIKRILFNWMFNAFSISEVNKERYLEKLSDEKMPAEAVFQGYYKQKEVEKDKSSSMTKEEEIKLRLYNPENTMNFIIDKEEFVLGKSPYRADGRIEGNIFVGNTHCKIIHSEGSYYVMDLESKNGTLLNGMRLTPKKLYVIKPGDVLILANVSFSVEEVRGV